MFLDPDEFVALQDYSISLYDFISHQRFKEVIIGEACAC